MASILELGVNTGKWDSGLKKAKSALDNFIQANGGLSQALEKESGKMSKFVGMMGNMESKAKTAKGQMNEYKSAIEQLTIQYNRMTDAQKKAIGQEYLQAIDKMKQKYHAVNEELQAMNRSLASGKESGGGGGGMGKFGGMLSVFGGNMLTKAAGWAMNFASEIGDCVAQGIELARAGEGVRLAFERLNRPDLLDKLREATHGTVTDLELMKQAVKFNDFNLSLDEMGTLLAFAQQKAKDTGESVDYMVDSIVTGLGRQSLMILDNLGISANEVKEKMKGTGDMTKAVAEIIRQQMSDAGDYIETAADRAAKADAEVQNAMEELGRTFQPISDAGAALWHNLKVGALDLLNSAIKPLIDNFTTLGRLRREYESAGGGTRVGGDLGKLGEHKSQQNYRILLAQYDREIQKRERAIGAWEAWRRGDRSAGAESEMMWAKSNYGTDTADMRAQLNAWKQMRSEFMSGAQDIFNPKATPAATGGGGGGTTTPRTGRVGGGRVGGGRVGGGTTHQKTDAEKAAEAVTAAEKNYKDAIATATMRFEAGMDNSEDLQKRELAARERLTMAYVDAYNLVGNQAYKESFEKSAVEFNNLADVVKGKREEFEASTTALTKMSITPMDDILKGLLGEDMQTFAKRKGINLDTGDGGTRKETAADVLAKTAGKIDKHLAPFSTISSGLQEMGIKVPEGIERMIAITQGVSTILMGISALLTLIQVDTKVTAAASVSDALIPFAGGGITKAAGGMFAGHRYSGDNIPVMVNSGELILNRAQQGNLASQLTNGGLQGLALEAYIEGEDIRLAVRNANRRRGRGEYVTTKTR